MSTSCDSWGDGDVNELGDVLHHVNELEDGLARSSTVPTRSSHQCNIFST